MKLFLLSITTAALTASLASAGTVNYDTNGTTLSCNGVTGCNQNSATSVSIGGLTFQYNVSTATGVLTPSNINLGNIASTGTGTGVDVTGLLLKININSTVGGVTKSGFLPDGTIAGSVSTNSSGAIITWSPSNTTSIFGTLPGATIGTQIYQVQNVNLGLQAPTVGNPVGQTSIQGAVTDSTATPEPATLALIGLGLGAIGLVRRRAV